MRPPAELHGQAPEERGKQIAGEFTSFFSGEVMRREAEQEQRRWTLDALEDLKTAIHRTVDGYNNNAPPRFWLALMDRADHMVFRFAGVVTLTLTWKERKLLLESYSGGTPETLPVSLDVWCSEDGVQLLAEVDSPSLPRKTLSKDEFACSLLRIACTGFFVPHTAAATSTPRVEPMPEKLPVPFSPPDQRVGTTPGGDAIPCRSWQRFLSPSFRRSWRPGSTN